MQILLISPEVCPLTAASVMVLGDVIHEGCAMPPQIFPQGLTINSAGYNKVLETVVKLCMDGIHVTRPSQKFT